jgi:hypothetical protein
MHQAFFNDSSLKCKILDRLWLHYHRNEFVQNQYWKPERNTGCAIGCTTHTEEHSSYPKLLGIPIELAYLEDAIYEGLPLEDARDFAIAFIERIPVGADLSQVWRKFVCRLFLDWDFGISQYLFPERTIATLNSISRLLPRKLVFDWATRLQNYLRFKHGDNHPLLQHLNIGHETFVSRGMRLFAFPATKDDYLEFADEYKTLLSELVRQRIAGKISIRQQDALDCILFATKTVEDPNYVLSTILKAATAYADGYEGKEPYQRYYSVQALHLLDLLSTTEPNHDGQPYLD